MQDKEWKLFNMDFKMLNKKLPKLIIAGPCVVESRELLFEVAGEIKPVCDELGIKFVFKSSYRKANRTSEASFEGIGDRVALSCIADVKEKYGVEVLTDVHSVSEVEMASEFVDVLQIPAFLSRQSDILRAAGRTGKTVNIKKGQFMAAEDILKAAEKVSSTGNDKIWLTERGTSFGYHDLIVDFRTLVFLGQNKYPVIYDATHSLQQPSLGEQSGGLPLYIKPLAKAAAAVGVDGLFFETHPDPKAAKSDSATQLPLADAVSFIREINKIWNVI